MRTIPGVETLLQPLEDSIKDTFIPSMCNGHQVNAVERELLALPPRMGGLGLINRVKMANQEFANSQNLTHQLVEKYDLKMKLMT